MAKNKLDDLDMDSLFNDFDDFSVESDDSKSRKPSSTLKSNARDFLKSGSKSTVKAAGGHILRAMPDANILVDDIVSAKNIGKDIVADVRKEMVGLATASKRMAAATLPSVKRVIPKKVYDKLEKLTKVEKESTYRSPTEEENAQSDALEEVKNIFGEQTDLLAQDIKQKHTDSFIQKSIDNIRFRKTTEILTSIDAKLSLTTKLSAGPHQAWMRKMLELKYMQLFTAKESLKSLKATTLILDTKLDAIIKNTGLPEVVKAKQTEYIKHTIRGKVASKAATSLTGMMTSVQQKYSSDVKNLISDFTSSLDMMTDMKETENEMGMQDSKGTSLGKFLGGIFGSIVGRSSIEKMRPVLGKVDRTSRDINSIIRTGGRTIKDKLETSNNPILNFIADFIPSTYAHVDIGNDLIAKGGEASIFDNATRQTIVEIIPAWLSLIAKNTKDIFTGTDTEQQWYDVSKRRIVGISAAKESIVQRVFGSTDTRSEGIVQTVGYMYGAGAKKGVKSSTLKNKTDDFKRVINNAIANNMTIDGLELLPYRDAKSIEDITSPTLKQLFKGTKDPAGVLKLLVTMLFDKNNKLDKDTQHLLNRGIIQEISKTNVGDSYSNILETFGAYTIFSDDIKNEKMSDEAIARQRMNIDDSRIDNAADVYGTEFNRLRTQITDEEIRAQNSKIVKLLPKRLREKAKKLADKNIPILSNFSNLIVPSDGRVESGENIISPKKGIKDSVSSELTKMIKDAEKKREKKKRQDEKLEESFYSDTPKSKIISPSIKRHKKIDRIIEEKKGKPKSFITLSIDKYSPSEDTHTELFSFHRTFIDYAKAQEDRDTLLYDAVMSIGNIDPTETKKRKTMLSRTLSTGKGFSKRILGVYESAIKSVGQIGKASIPAIGSIVGGGLNGLGSLLGGGLKGLGFATKGIANVTSSFYSGLFKTGRSIFGKDSSDRTTIKSQKREQFFDVYRNKEISPGQPLLSVKKQKGGRCIKSNGKPLLCSDDIDMPIIDSKTGDTLISQEDIDHGLVDITGTALGNKKIKIKRQGGIAASSISGLSNILGKGLFGLITGGSSIYGGMLKGMGALGKGAFDFFGSKIQNKKYAPITDRLDKIYNILDTRLAKKKTSRFDKDGDGIRDGSYAEQTQGGSPIDSIKNKILGIGSYFKNKKEDKKGPTIYGDSPKESTKEGGLFGKVAGAAGGLFAGYNILKSGNIANALKATRIGKVGVGLKNVATAGGKGLQYVGGGKAAVGKSLATRAGTGALAKGASVAMLGAGAIRGATMNEEDMYNYGDTYTEGGAKGWLKKTAGTMLNPYEAGKAGIVATRMGTDAAKATGQAIKSYARANEMERNLKNAVLDKLKENNAPSDVVQEFENKFKSESPSVASSYARSWIATQKDIIDVKENRPAVSTTDKRDIENYRISNKVSSGVNETKKRGDAYTEEMGIYKKQTELMEAMVRELSRVGIGIGKVVDNTGTLTHIDESLGENLKEATKKPEIIINTPPPTIIRDEAFVPAIDASKQRFAYEY